jgi:hypothetical protein
MKRLAWSGLVLLVGAWALEAHAAPPPEEIHACLDAAGNVVYQDDECDTPKATPKVAATAERATHAAPKSKSKAKASPSVKAEARAVSSAPAVKRASAPATKGIKPVIDPATFTSDPRWGSPERTLKTFIAAMKDGDRALARSCLTADALTDFGPRVDSLPPETLRATVNGYTGFVLEGDLGPFWSIRAIRGKDRPKWIFFERVPDGSWKISAI